MRLAVEFTDHINIVSTPDAQQIPNLSHFMRLRPRIDRADCPAGCYCRTLEHYFLYIEQFIVPHINYISEFWVKNKNYFY